MDFFQPSKGNLEDYVVSQLHSSNIFTRSFYDLISIHLDPFIPFMRPYSPPTDPVVISNLAKQFTPFLNKLINALPSFITESPELTRKSAYELLYILSLCVDCFEVIAPVLGELYAAVNYRDNYISCLKHWELHDEARSESFVSLASLNRILTLQVQNWKKDGGVKDSESGIKLKEMEDQNLKEGRQKQEVTGTESVAVNEMSNMDMLNPEVQEITVTTTQTTQSTITRTEEATERSSEVVSKKMLTEDVILEDKDDSKNQANGNGFGSYSEFIRDFIFPCLSDAAIYERKYLLGTSMARPVIARAIVDAAKEVGADAVSHGCKGKGNDQVRFELTFFALNPELSVVAEEYGKDTVHLNTMIDDMYANFTSRPLILVPGGFYDNSWFDKLLQVSGSHIVNIVSHHMYKLGPGNDPNFVSKILKPDHLNKASTTFSNLTRTIKDFGPWAYAWVGELGGVYNNGAKDISITFVNSLWYLDHLGLAAKYNTKVYCRQNLIGGFYGFLNKTTFLPNLDYYSALLWHRLVGTKSRGMYETPGSTILFTAARELESLTLELKDLGEIVPEPIDKWQNIGRGHFYILEAFYAESEKYAYTFQNYVFVNRVMQEKGSSDCIKPLRVMERSVFSDRMVFVRAVHKAQWMNEMEISIYESWVGPVVSSLPGFIPDGFIYLRASPDTCHKRMMMRKREEEGGFGSVFWGQLLGSSQIAVKRLKSWSNKADMEFSIEVEILARVRHKNLLIVHGYCAEGPERLLVYDYMTNLSLLSHLHGQHSAESHLDWNRRMNLAIGAAEGIVYLHYHATPHMIYIDIKGSKVDICILEPLLKQEGEQKRVRYRSKCKDMHTKFSLLSIHIWDPGGEISYARIVMADHNLEDKVVFKGAAL